MLIVLWICMDDSIVVDIHTFKTDKVSGRIKLAVLSDFHCANADEVLDIVEEINPDAILIPGDLVDENVSLNSVERLLNGIKRYPSFYVSGNHEYKKGKTYKSYSHMVALLEEAGIYHLENESQVVCLNGQKLWIGGVQDHTSNKTKDPDELDQMNIDKVCTGFNELFSIFLMHRPEQYHFIEKYSVDLVVSGHAHGGQWRFPGVNGLFAPQQGLFPKRAGGIYPMKHGVHLVSRGLAHYWFLPRILNHREINVIIIEKRQIN